MIGGSEVLVIESNQNHATITDTEVCTTLPASMGMGGGYIPMIVDELKHPASDPIRSVLTTILMTAGSQSERMV